MGVWIVPNPTHHSPPIQLNTRNRNDNLVNGNGVTLIFALFAFLGGLPVFFLAYIEVNIREFVLAWFFSVYCVLTVLLPTLYFAMTPSRIRTVIDLFY